MGLRVAAIYDIHGNAFALEAVLKEIDRERVDIVLMGGDLVWGPQPKSVMERLLAYGEEREVRWVRGNADREVAGRYGVEQGLEPWVAEVNRWCADQLNGDQLAFLESMPERQILDVEGLGEVLFVHGSPRSDEEAIRRDTPAEEITPMLADVRQLTVVCGHTHVPFDRRVGEKRIVNPGSVGLPSGAKGACWALLGPDVSLRKTVYDTETAASEIRRSGVPLAEEFARHILNPPVTGP